MITKITIIYRQIGVELVKRHLTGDNDATSPITVTIYDVSIVIVCDVTLLLSMTYHFQSCLGKTDCTDIWVIKLKNQVSPSIGFRIPHRTHTISLIKVHRYSFWKSNKNLFKISEFIQRLVLSEMKQKKLICLQAF